MPRQTPGNYVPLDVNYPHDAAIRTAGEAAELLFVRGIAYCKRVRSDGFIPEYDLPVVAVGLRSPQKRVTALVTNGLWRPVDGGWVVRSWAKWNKPAAVEEAFAASQAEYGTRGNHERWHAGRGVVDEGCPHCSTPTRQPDRIPDRQPDRQGESPIREGKKSKTPLPPSADASGFDEFWKLYPRKIAKRAAEKAWRAAVKRTDPPTILDALRRAAFPDDPQYVPHPATWLNQDRWADQPTRLLAAVNGHRTWSAAELETVLGPDRWTCPQPPSGLSPDEMWDWEQRVKREHRAERIRQAEAKTGAAS